MRKETGFNELIRKIRKELFGKGPERIHTSFVDNLAVTMLYGNLTQAEKFLVLEDNGKRMIDEARTKMIQKMYPLRFQREIEEYMENTLVHLFIDIDLDRDVAVSVFLFQEKINP